MNCYYAHVAMLDGMSFEHGFDVVFIDKDNAAAVKSAARFAKGRERQLGWRFVAVKVGEFVPFEVGKDGHYTPAERGIFFEWKYDWPGTLEERIGEIPLAKPGVAMPAAAEGLLRIEGLIRCQYPRDPCERKTGDFVFCDNCRARSMLRTEAAHASELGAKVSARAAAPVGQRDLREGEGAQGPS